jgi:hypothetical protein
MSIAIAAEYWHEELGPVLWWHFPICEPPYVGTPLDTDWVGNNWCTHFTPIEVPEYPDLGAGIWINL